MTEIIRFITPHDLNSEWTIMSAENHCTTYYPKVLQRILFEDILIFMEVLSMLNLLSLVFIYLK